MSNAPDEHEIIRQVLLNEEKIPGPRGEVFVRMSTFRRLLNELRPLAGRNPASGWQEKNADDWPLIPVLIGYCTILDHIGGCYEPLTPEVTKEEKRDFVRALKCFPASCRDLSDPTKPHVRNVHDLNDNEIEALYAFRCALVHEGAFVNKDRSRKYVFRMVRDIGRKVELPKKLWTGDLADVSDECITKIDGWGFVTLAETIVTQVLQLAKCNGLRCRLKGSAEELRRCYLMDWLSFDPPQKLQADP